VKSILSNKKILDILKLYGIQTRISNANTLINLDCVHLNYLKFESLILNLSNVQRNMTYRIAEIFRKYETMEMNEKKTSVINLTQILDHQIDDKIVVTTVQKLNVPIDEPDQPSDSSIPNDLIQLETIYNNLKYRKTKSFI